MFNVLSDNTQAAKEGIWKRLMTEGATSQNEIPGVLQLTPWYIQLMQTFAAWIASLFILAFSITFFGLFWDDLDTGFATAIGFFYGGFAVFLYRLSAGQTLFISQMAFALSLCGLLSLGYGMTDWFSDNLGTNLGLAWYFTFGAILLINWFLIEQYSHQCVMSFGVTACLVGMGYELRLLELLPMLILLLFVGVWLNLGKTAKHFARMNALGLTLALWVVLIQLPLLASQSRLLDSSEFPVVAQWSHGLSVGITLLILAGLLVKIFRSLLLSVNSKTALICALGMLLLAGLSISMAGLASAAVLMVVGFYVKERAVFFLGVAGIFSFIGWYYYSLQLPLLEKSIWLISLGLLLISVRLLMAKVLTKERKQGINSDEI